MIAAASSKHEEEDPSIIKDIDLLYQGTARDLRTMQVKLTYVGPQTKPVPTVVLNTFYHLIRMDWFSPLRKSNLHYDNDEISVCNFTVTPEEMKKVVTALRQVKALREPDETKLPYLSLMIVMYESRLGQFASEIVLNRKGAESVSSAIRDSLDVDNGLGRKVMDLQSQIIYT